MFDVSFIYKIVDKFSRPSDIIQASANKTKRAVRGMGDAARRAGGAFQRTGQKLRGMADLQNSAAAAAATFAIAMPTKRAMAFEQAVTNLDKALDFDSANSRSAFINDLRTMAPSLGLTSTNMANLAFEAAKLGIAQDEIAGFTKLAAQASVAFDGLAIEDAGQIIGDLKTRFGLATDGVGEMLDAINKLADNTNRSGGEILNVVGRLSGQFSSLKFPPELGAGLATFARQIATTDELASSGMKMFLRELDQAKLAAAPIETITETLRGLADMGIADRAFAIEDMFGKEAATFVSGMVDKIDTLGSTMGIVADKSNFLGSMQAEFARQAGTAGFKVQELKAGFDNLMVTIGERIIPILVRALAAIKPVVAAVGRFVENNPNIVKAGVAFVAVGTAVLGLAAGVGIIMGLVSPVGLLVAGVVALGAGITAVWGDMKAWLADVTGPFKGLADIAGTFMGAIGGTAAKVGEFFGIGGQDPTIADPDRTTPGGDLLSAAGQSIGLNGSIGISVDGPGRVTESSLESDAGGDLGMNLGAVRR